jgi:hypothetical protein
LPELLTEFAEAGLVDVVFDVDMTKKRRGHDCGRALNALPREYIERARGSATLGDVQHHSFSTVSLLGSPRSCVFSCATPMQSGWLHFSRRR